MTCTIIKAEREKISLVYKIIKYCFVSAWIQFSAALPGKRFPIPATKTVIDKNKVTQERHSN